VRPETPGVLQIVGIAGDLILMQPTFEACIRITAFLCEPAYLYIHLVVSIKYIYSFFFVPVS